jgi:hypothetical protein
MAAFSNTFQNAFCLEPVKFNTFMAFVQIAPPPVADAVLQALLASFNIPVGAVIDNALLGISLERCAIMQHTRLATQAECGAAEAYHHQLISIAGIYGSHFIT